MSQILNDILDTFGTSEPIFKGELNKNRTEVSFEVIKKYDAPTYSFDPVVRILAENYKEVYNRAKKKWEKGSIINDAYADIVNYLIKMYEKFSDLKNPKQSKLYRWLHQNIRYYNHNYSDGFVMLFRYVSSNGETMGKTKENPHIKNAMAILEKMRLKYGKEKN